MPSVFMYAPENFPDVHPGMDLPAIIVDVLRNSHHTPKTGDILVVAQKIVSKAEGRIVDLREIAPSEKALTLAREADRDPRLVEVILREARAILRVRPGLIIAEHRLGFICANAGVDHSNVGGGEDVVTLLPSDPDASAQAIKRAVDEAFGVDVAVIINDSHGRPFREGAVGVCIGVAGMDPLRSYVGMVDRYGYVLRSSVEAIADELASAATLLMGQAGEGRPLVVIRGIAFQGGERGARALLRDPSRDLFR
ncbi:MAG: coenzyme F420-0:L-glutamate ligase [Armatimonadota bacterium]|nr:coenzyme F420-0:L-glutamate ligase [Armatimonadota bacterium]